METTIDAAGRVVIPKALRERLGLTGGQRLEIEERDGYVRIGPAPTAVRLESRDGVLTAIPDEPLPSMDADTVRATLENVRR